MTLPLVDSLTHPSLAGTWMGKAAGAGFDALVGDMRRHGVAAACAVGMWGMDGFEPESFRAACRAHPGLIPIAGYKPTEASRIAGELDRIAALDYAGIKLHPRFSDLDITSPLLPEVLRAARDRGLVVFYCTYHHCRLDRYPREDPFHCLVRMLQAAPGARVVLLHGGDVDLLRHMQLVRFNDDLLLDLSHTLLKYPGSSLDLDLRFLFHQFDRRICVGSDWPQFTAAALRSRFEDFATGLAEAKSRNIAHGNLLRFLGREDLLDRIAGTVPAEPPGNPPPSPRP